MLSCDTRRHAGDVPVIAELIRGLAEYERLADEVVLDEEELRSHLFGERRYAEVMLAEDDGARRRVRAVLPQLLDLPRQAGDLPRGPVRAAGAPGRGHGKALLSHLARLAVERGCGRLEWSVLDWNEPSIAFYRSLGARAMDEWTVHRLDGDALRALAGGA